MSDPTNSLPYNELEKVLKSFVKENSKEANAAVKAKSNNNNNNCIKDAEAAAAKAREHHEAMIIHQNTASGESTASNNNTTPTQTQTTPTIASSTTADSTSGKGEDLSSSLLNAPMPQTHDEAISMLNKLRTMRDDLLVEQDRNNKFVSRYQEKVAKSERMATLHHLIPRELFVREDRYQQELEHVYKWSGISDQEIADIYLLKLKKSGIKQHGASTRDPYQNFRDVPDFSKVNGKGNDGHSSSSNSNNVLKRNLEFMKKIATGSSGNN